MSLQMYSLHSKKKIIVQIHCIRRSPFLSWFFLDGGSTSQDRYTEGQELCTVRLTLENIEAVHDKK